MEIEGRWERCIYTKIWAQNVTKLFIITS